MSVGFPKPKRVKKSAKHPDRDEFDLEELAMTLNEALNTNKTYSFAVFNKDEPIVGKVTKMDPNTKLITIQRYGEIFKAHFLDILKVNSFEG